jgi:hypothetical protein
MTVKITKDRVPALLKAVRDLTKQEVLVGIPAENAGRDDDAPINNAELGYIHEFGAPAANIPPRPFLVPGITGAESRFTPHMEAAAGAAIDGNEGRVSQGLNRAGIVAASAVKTKIDEGPFAPLSEVTIERKGSDKPLLDTGQMRNAVTHVVRKKGDA